MSLRAIFERFFRIFHAVRVLTLLVWITGIAICGYYAPTFFTITVSSLEAPSGSQSEAAVKALEQYFPNTLSTNSLTLMFRCETGPSCVVDEGPWLKGAIDQVSGILTRFGKENPDMKDYVISFTTMYNVIGNLSEVPPYDAAYVRMAFVSKSNRSSITTITCARAPVPKRTLFVTYIRSWLPTVDTQAGNYSLHLAGADTMFVDSNKSVLHDLEIMDMIALPIALLILALVLRSFVLMIIPILAVGSCVAISFSLMIPVAQRITVAAYIPSVMMAILLGTSIDYSLFLLTRYREELNRGRSNYSAVAHSLWYSGGTILISAVTLLACFVGLWFFPVELVQCMGWAAVISVMASMTTSLVLTPTLLLCFGQFFSAPGIIPCIPCCRNTTIPSPEDEWRSEVNSNWFKFAQWTTTYKYLTIFLTVLFLTPVSLGLLKMKLTQNALHGLPHHCETLSEEAEMAKDWRTGEIYSYTVIAVAKNATLSSIKSYEYFNVSHQLAMDISNLSTSVLKYTDILSISDVAGNYIDWDSAQFYMEASKFYNYAFTSMVNKNATASTMTLFPENIDPNAQPDVVPTAIRPLLQYYSRTSNFEFHLYSMQTIIFDAVTAVVDLLPYILLIMSISVAVLISLIFRSVLLSLRMLITIALTLLWAYGAMSIIFSTSWFWWLSEVIKEQPDVDWSLLLLSFILIGLGLDYDVFLTTRIMEYRNQGWGNRAAVVKGVTKTGSVITFAGIIMAIAFSGLAASEELTLKQIGLLMTLAVLLDTFVIRTTLNPACFSVFGRFNYWPRKPPIEFEDPTVFSRDKELDEVDKLITFDPTRHPQEEAARPLLDNYHVIQRP